MILILASLLEKVSFLLQCILIKMANLLKVFSVGTLPRGSLGVAFFGQKFNYLADSIVTQICVLFFIML